VQLNWKIPALAALAAATLLDAGCSGINTGASASPASFFLPGLLKNDAPVQTNAPDAAPEISGQLASGK